MSWTRKNLSPKKLFKIGDSVDCVITEIDKEKRRVAISYRLTKENPYDLLEKKYPVGSEIEGKISSINEYAIYLNIEDFDIDAFLHSNDLSYTGNSEQELKKYRRGEKLKVKVLEIKKDDQKVRVGLKQLKPDPWDYFKNKKVKVKDIITVKVISSCMMISLSVVSPSKSKCTEFFFKILSTFLRLFLSTSIMYLP